MAEIVYQYSGEKKEDNSNFSIRWLKEQDYDIFCRHLELCGQKMITETVWKEIFQEETTYAGLFVGEEMVARACIEKYSEEFWEVGDVRVVKSYRNHGYAHVICSFVLNEIVSQGRIPTIRTEEENYAMQRVIDKLGFLKFTV